MPTERSKIHVIEDEQDIARLIQYNLALEGFDVSCSFTGEEGLDEAQRQHPNLVILDLMLPGLDGLEVCKRMKKIPELDSTSIIMLTAKGEELDIVKGLELGADDYITKPFSPKVLTARVRAVLRRAAADTEPTDGIISIDGLKIHPGRHEVSVKDKALDLTQSEFQILLVLARRPGWVFTRTQLVDALHGNDYAVTDRTIDFQMVGLRKKLGSMSEYIETVRGVGYRFKNPEGDE